MGRPPIRGEPAVRIIAFRLTESEYLRLQRVAASCSLTVGQFFGQAVNEAAADLGEAAVFRAGSVISSPALPRN
jgi:hypothetical protein